MPFYIRKGDITESTADAIVNAANPSLLGGGGVDGAIHRAAGPGLREACAGLGGCRPGEAKITAGYRLPAKYVVHTVGPIWQGGDAGEREILASCYRASLDLAEEAGCASVAFPLISAGAYGYPEAEAMAVAADTILSWLGEHDPDMRVDLVLYDNRLRERYRDLRRELEGLAYPRAVQSAESKAARPVPPKKSLFRRAPRRAKKESADAALYEAMEDAECAAPPAPVHANAFADAFPAAREKAPAARKTNAVGRANAAGHVNAAPFDDTLAFGKPQSQSLADAVAHIDESFSEMLLRKIDERGMKDSACYRRANVDRKLFSKIRSDPHYRPSKPTAIAFAIALELPMEEAEDLLRKAGYALSPSSAFDVIIRYYIERGNYNLFEINEALFAFDQNQLGA